MRITITWRNDNPNTIYNVLARKLGREPTNAEVFAELDRITSEVQADLAAAGRLRFQRGAA